jgi:hypothetical protein
VAGGSSPDKAGGASVLPDGVGPASGTERSTRGTGGVKAPQRFTGSKLVDMGREQRAPDHRGGGWGTSGSREAPAIGRP